MANLQWLKAMWKSPVEKIGLVLGVVLLLLSFDPLFYHDEQWSFRLTPYPANWILFGVAIALLLPVVFSLWGRRQAPQVALLEIPDGYRIEAMQRLS